MQQPPALPYYYTTAAAPPAALYNQDGGGPAHQQWVQDNNKPNQYHQQQWDNNGGFNVTSSGNYGPGQVHIQGGGQNRVQVGPQQPQQPSQPPPVSTPPNIHGDMNKQSVMQNQQQAQMNFIARPAMNQGFAFPRGIPQPTRLQPHNRGQIVANTFMQLGPQQVQQVLTQATAPATIVQYPQAALMYGQQRTGTPYPNQPGGYLIQQNYYNPQPNHFYPQIPIQAQQYPTMTSGGPSPQGTTQQPSVSIMRPMTQSVQSAPVPQTMKQEPKKRTHAIKIIDPTTNEEVAINNESGGNNNNITPTRSNDSSARETPQPNSGITTDNTVAADFAARVAAIAIASEPPTLPPTETVQDIIPSESEIHHKQLPVVVPSSEKVLSTVLSTSSEEFIPRSLKPAQPCEPPVEEPRTTYVPTVSAETNSPVVEIQRPKEQFPALKNSGMPSATTQSPLRVNSKKQKGGENERQQVINVPVNVVQIPPPPPSVDTKDNLNNKKGPKNSQKEDVAVPKERRDKPRTVTKEQSPAPSPVVSPDSASSPDLSGVSMTKPSPLPSASFGKDGGKSSMVTSSASVEEPSVKVQQHQNGETTEPTMPEPTMVFDGSKTAKQKSKKPGKMRDLNRKGVDKEGSDMDAFMETSIVNDNRPQTPVSPPPSAIKLPPTSPPPSLEPQSPVDKIKEDLEEKEDKLVAAKNEENTKVSALTQPEEPAPVAIASDKSAPPQLTLKHSYKKDQWSPINPEGKKKYERDFLMGLKQDSQSQHKPINLPDIVAVLRDNSNNMRNQNMNFQSMNRGDLGGIIHPSFMQRSSQSQRGPLPKRGSQQGMKGKGPGPKGVIHVSLSLHEDVKLRTAENAWKPNRLVHDGEKSEQDKQTEELYKNVRGVLNKLTPQKFDTLMKKFMAFPINSEERLIGVIQLIFEKAVDEPSFSKAYANMCKLCSKLEVSKLENGQEQKVNFRKILITRCQTEFESNKPDLLEGDRRLEEIKNCADPEQKKELQAAYDEKERQIRMKSVGNIRFIGELFKLGMLTPAIMYRCIEHLLNTPEEESLECLCKLLTTIGRDLELGPQNSKSNGPPPAPLKPYFQRMSDLASRKDSTKVSSRVRFMLQDVIDLRANKWVPRREDNNPKTIDQITKEAERESIEMTIALNQQPPRMNRQNDRQDDRKRGNRGGNQQNEDGWNTVSSNRHFSSKNYQSFDTSKIQNIVKPEMDLNTVSLGGSSQFRFSSAPKTMDNKSSFTSSNVFSALQNRGDERKPPPQPNMNNNRRITPTPSIEKDRERQRMIQGLESSGDGRNSRGSSAQRERPQPPSRECSQPRLAPTERDNKEATEAKAQEKNTRNVDEKAARLAEEKLERQTHTIFEEYLGNFTTVDDARQEIEQLYPGEKVGDFVQKALTISLEKKAGTQKSIGLLLSALMDYNLFSAEVIVEQLGCMYEVIDDFAIDVPKVWELQAQVIVPILAAEKINFSHFKAACDIVLKTNSAPKLLVPVLNLAVQEKGAGFTRKVWDSSNVTLKDFLPPDVNIDAFITEHSLEYLIGEAPKYEGSSNQVSMDQVQMKLLRLMQSNRPYEEIVDYITTNVGGERIEDLHFIRALITAICEACIASTSNHNLDKVKFKQYEKLIQRFVDNKEDRELACLNAVHILVCRLEHPSGLIKNIFNLLFENNLISCESFLKWNVDDQEKLENKGVSTMSLTSFFTALEEGETDEENS